MAIQAINRALDQGRVPSKEDLNNLTKQQKIQMAYALFKVCKKPSITPAPLADKAVTVQTPAQKQVVVAGPMVSTAKSSKVAEKALVVTPGEDNSKKPAKEESVSFFQRMRNASPEIQATLNRLAQPKVLALVGSVAAVHAIAAAAIVKFGLTFTASTVASSMIAFLTPGLTFAAIALQISAKAAIATTVNVAMPFILPIISTIVVTTLLTLITAYIAYKVLQAMKNKIVAGFEALSKKLDENFMTRTLKNAAIVAFNAFTESPEDAEQIEMGKDEVQMDVFSTTPERKASTETSRYNFSPRALDSDDDNYNDEDTYDLRFNGMML